MVRPTALHRLHSALTEAARRYSEAFRASDGASTLADRAAHALVLQLALPADLILDPRPAASLAPGHEAAVTRLRVESRRLARLARARSPAYDLNRHIAVRRLFAALHPPAGTTAASPSGAGDGATLRPARPTQAPVPRILFCQPAARG